MTDPRKRWRCLLEELTAAGALIWIVGVVVALLLTAYLVR